MYAASALYPATYHPNDIFHRRKVKLSMELKDEEILKKGILDYISFSYYRSNIISTQTQINVIGGNANPYLETIPTMGMTYRFFGITLCFK